MEWNESVGMLLFFSILASRGGAALGAGLRALWRRNATMTMLGGTIVLLTVQDGLSVPLLIGGGVALLGVLFLITTVIGVLRAL